MLQSIVGLPALVFACTSCYAGVVVGYPLPLNTEPNSAPFGDTGSFVITRYQQVYSDTAFGGQVLITDLEFFTNDVVFGGYIQAGTYAISLSTTAKAVNGLDTVDLNNNIGSDVLLVDTLTVGSNVYVPKDSVWTIVLSTPFTYNPADGNLLLDISIHPTGAGGVPPVTFDAWGGQSGSPFSRAFDCTGCTGTSNYGLVTGFDAAVPEPATFGDVAGLLAVLVVLRVAIGARWPYLRDGRYLSRTSGNTAPLQFVLMCNRCDLAEPDARSKSPDVRVLRTERRRGHA